MGTASDYDFVEAGMLSGAPREHGLASAAPVLIADGPEAARSEAADSGRTRLRTMRIAVGSVGTADVAAWGEADRAAEPNPFYRPEFLLANAVHRHIAIELLDREGRGTLACLPASASAASHAAPASVSLTALADEYSFSGTPLIDRDELERAADGLLQLAREEGRVAILLIPMFNVDGPVGRALQAAARRHDVRLSKIASFQRAAWHRAPKRHFPGPSFNRSDRRELSRTARRLREELGGDPGGCRPHPRPIGLGGVSGDGACGLEGRPRDGSRQQIAGCAILRRMCAGMSAAGRFELLCLEVGGRTIAMESHLLDGATLWPFKIAHDPAYRRFSPRPQMIYRVIDSLHDRAIEIADTGAVPENAHMNRLWPDRRTLHFVLIPTGAPAARLVPLVLLARVAVRDIQRQPAACRRAQRQTDSSGASRPLALRAPRDWKVRVASQDDLLVSSLADTCTPRVA